MDHVIVKLAKKVNVPEYRFVFKGTVDGINAILMVMAGPEPSRISGTYVVRTTKGPASGFEADSLKKLTGWSLTALLPKEACQALYGLPVGTSVAVRWKLERNGTILVAKGGFSGVDVTFTLETATLLRERGC